MSNLPGGLGNARQVGRSCMVRQGATAVNGCLEQNLLSLARDLDARGPGTFQRQLASNHSARGGLEGAEHLLTDQPGSNKTNVTIAT